MRNSNNYKLVSKRQFLCDELEASEIKLAEVNGSIFVCMTDKRLEPSAQVANLILKFNEKLSILNKLYLIGIAVLSFESCDGKLYFLAENESDSKKRIFVYDENLNELERIGQREEQNLPFYVPDNVGKMRISADFFVLYSSANSCLTMMNRADGVAENRWLNPKHEDFVVDRDSNLIFWYDSNSNQLLVVDEDGQYFIEDFGFIRGGELKLVGCHEGKLVFFDSLNFLFLF